MLKVLMSHWIILMIFFLSLLIVFAKYFYVVLFNCYASSARIS